MNRLMVSGSNPPPRAILFTSARPQEGKTMVSVLLAITMALARKRVLILDADLRAPALHEVFGLRQDVGLTDVLEDAGVKDVIQTVAIDSEAGGPSRSLSVITSGALRPDLARTLGSQQASRAVEQLREAFDFLLLDTPPILSVDDALPLLRLVDGVVLVLRAGEVGEPDAVAAKTLIDRSGGRLLGVVMNRVLEDSRGPIPSSRGGQMPGLGA